MLDRGKRFGFRQFRWWLGGFWRRSGAGSPTGAGANGMLEAEAGRRRRRHSAPRSCTGADSAGLLTGFDDGAASSKIDERPALWAS